MHVISIPQPRLRLPSHLPLLSLLPFCRREVRPEVLCKVLYYQAGFGEEERLSEAVGFDADYGRFAERVDLFEGGWGDLGGFAVVELEGIG